LNYPKISIITPSLNQGDFIEKTIDSVLSQNYPNLDYIIIDGGSSDNSIEIIKKYSKYLSYWVSEKDNGQASAINKGLKLAKGEFANWLNSDDYYEPQTLFNIAECIQSLNDKNVICGYTRCFNDEDNSTTHLYRMGIKKSVSSTILNVEMNQPGSFFRTSVFTELGYLNCSLNYIFDSEFWFRYLCKYGLESIGFTDYLFANFRYHPNSKSIRMGPHEFYKEFLNIYLFLAKELKLNDAINKYLSQDQLIERYSSLSWDYQFIEVDEFNEYFFEKYKFKLYKDFNYKESLIGLKYYLTSNNKYDLIKHYALAIKLLFPTNFINFVRNVKHLRFNGN
jgi:glycosyltransferase involved in cell wall biosynthesis